MPTYVYECRTCAKTFEVKQRITADPLKDCDCGAQGSLRRLIQPVAVSFKGSGFHINDYSGSKSSTTPAPKAEAPAGECGNGGCASCTPTES
jgi:putative FmdB family regulatory protein